MGSGFLICWMRCLFGSINIVGLFYFIFFFFADGIELNGYLGLCFDLDFRIWISQHSCLFSPTFMSERSTFGHFQTEMRTKSTSPALLQADDEEDLLYDSANPAFRFLFNSTHCLVSLLGFGQSRTVRLEYKLPINR